MRKYFVHVKLDAEIEADSAEDAKAFFYRDWPDHLGSYEVQVESVEEAAK